MLTQLLSLPIDETVRIKHHAVWVFCFFLIKPTFDLWKMYAEVFLMRRTVAHMTKLLIYLFQ